MAEIKEKHPSWFKMKLERRELVRQLAPETAVNVLLACWDFLETGETPGGLSPIENVAFAAFMPDMTEAWEKYIQRISARQSTPHGSSGIDRNRPIPNETEEESEPESKKDSYRGKKPQRRPRFIPPTVEEVAEYVQSRNSNVDPQGFVDFYEANGWMIGKSSMRDWKAACRNAEKWERWKQPQQPPVKRTGILTKNENGEEIVRFE